MRSVQRVYVYVLALASLVAMTVGIVNLTGVVVSPLVGLPFDPEAFARWAGILVIALPLYLGHIFWANRMARRSEEERRSGWRKGFEYSVETLGDILIVVFWYKVLRSAVLMDLGGWHEDVRLWWLTVAKGVLNGVWGMILVVYVRLLIQGDGDELHEGRWGRVWRRLSLLLMGWIGLFLFLRGGVLFPQVGILAAFVSFPGALTIGAWWFEPLSSGVASFVVGWGTWRWSWLRWEVWAAKREEEAMSLCRQLFLYSGLAVGLGLFLVGLGYLLRQGLLGILGVPLGEAQMWVAHLVWACVAIGVGGLIGGVHRRFLNAEAVTRERPALLVERLYTYVVSGVALIVLWWGGVDVLQAMAVRVFSLPGIWGVSALEWRRTLATGLALILVAGPVWWWHWRRVQRWARRLDDVGHAERVSLLRRVYVYGVSLIAGLVVLVYVARLAYYVWLRLLNVPVDTLMNLVGVVGPALVALGVWGYHLTVVMGDMRRERVWASGDTRLKALLAERERLLARIEEVEREIKRLKGKGDEAVAGRETSKMSDVR